MQEALSAAPVSTDAVSQSQFQLQAACSKFCQIVSLSKRRTCAAFHAMSRLATITVLLSVASGRRTGDISLTATPSECGAVPSTKEYFDGLRGKYGIQECTKKDVCLLMRQLDAYFYTRARQGQLVNYDEPPQMSWVHNGRCAKNSRSIKMEPVTKASDCSFAVRAQGINKKIKVTSSSTLPTGCSIKNGRGYLNSLETNVEADVSYEPKDPSKPWSQTRKTEIIQYCQIDHSLNEAAASYYSPYKLKESMKSKPQMLGCF